MKENSSDNAQMSGIQLIIERSFTISSNIMYTDFGF